MHCKRESNLIAMQHELHINYALVTQQFQVGDYWHQQVLMRTQALVLRNGKRALVLTFHSWKFLRLVTGNTGDSTHERCFLLVSLHSTAHCACYSCSQSCVLASIGLECAKRKWFVAMFTWHPVFYPLQATPVTALHLH